MRAFKINITICKLVPSTYSSLHSSYELRVGVQTTNDEVRNTKRISWWSLICIRKTCTVCGNKYSGPFGNLDNVR
jgi:hypothetical protein